MEERGHEGEEPCTPPMDVCWLRAGQEADSFLGFPPVFDGLPNGLMEELLGRRGVFLPPPVGEQCDERCLLRTEAREPPGVEKKDETPNLTPPAPPYASPPSSLSSPRPRAAGSPSKSSQERRIFKERERRAEQSDLLHVLASRVPACRSRTCRKAEVVEKAVCYIRELEALADSLTNSCRAMSASASPQNSPTVLPSPDESPTPPHDVAERSAPPPLQSYANSTNVNKFKTISRGVLVVVLVVTTLVFPLPQMASGYMPSSMRVLSSIEAPAPSSLIYSPYLQVLWYLFRWFIFFLVCGSLFFARDPTLHLPDTFKGHYFAVGDHIDAPCDSLRELGYTNAPPMSGTARWRFLCGLVFQIGRQLLHHVVPLGLGCERAIVRARDAGPAMSRAAVLYIQLGMGYDERTGHKLERLYCLLAAANLGEASGQADAILGGIYLVLGFAIAKMTWLSTLRHPLSRFYSYLAENYPGSVWKRLVVSLLAVKSGNWNEAERTADRALKDCQVQWGSCERGDLTLNVDGVTWLLYAKSLTYLNHGRGDVFPLARAGLRLAWAYRDPAHVIRALGILSTVFIRQSKPEEAVRLLGDVLRDNSSQEGTEHVVDTLHAQSVFVLALLGIKDNGRAYRVALSASECMIQCRDSTHLEYSMALFNLCWGYIELWHLAAAGQPLMTKRKVIQDLLQNDESRPRGILQNIVEEQTRDLSSRDPSFAGTVDGLCQLALFHLREIAVVDAHHPIMRPRYLLLRGRFLWLFGEPGKCRLAFEKALGAASDFDMVYDYELIQREITKFDLFHGDQQVSNTAVDTHQDL